MARRKRKKRGRGTLFIIAIVILIAGFIVRRTFVPQLLHYLAYGPASKQSPAASATTSSPEVSQSQGPSPSENTGGGPNENLTEQDRRQLEEVLKRKGR